MQINSFQSDPTPISLPPNPHDCCPKVERRNLKSSSAEPGLLPASLPRVLGLSLYTGTLSSEFWKPGWWFSKCGPRNPTRGISWKLLRKANSWAPTPDLLNQRLGEGMENFTFTDPPGDSEAYLSWRPTQLDILCTPHSDSSSPASTNKSLKWIQIMLPPFNFGNKGMLQSKIQLKFNITVFRERKIPWSQK